MKMKQFWRKFISMLTVLTMAAGMLSACGSSDEGKDTQQTEAQGNIGTQEQPDADTEQEADSADSEEAQDNADDENEQTSENPEHLTAIEVADLMGNGINLGNTMEAYGRASFGVGAEVSAYETAWGQPVTTQEIITAMKEAGFNSLRIPVAWTNAMDFESGDYTIGEDYLNRVEEIVNYAFNEDMYVVVNDHWDGGWWGMFGSATQETRTQAMEMYVSMWTQIAEHFRDYSDHLIFESANEELGNRLNDTDIASDSGTLSQDECYEMTNLINQTFVDTIRATGGNNENRFLLIAGYNTDIASTCDDRFVMPGDTADHKLLVSVHYYNPDGYCINTSLSNWGTAGDYEEQNKLLAMMTKFTDQGYGVVFGEYAVALNGDGSVKENTVDYLENFVNNCDLYGYCPMLWDCSSLFHRDELRMIDDEIADMYLAHSLEAQNEMTHDEIAQAAQSAMDEAIAGASEDTGLSDDIAMAWIMYNSSDWSIIYSVGDEYDPASKTEGVVATDVEITGEGTYTVSLDFTGTAAGYADSTAFSALAIGNGETLFPGYVISITEILINGEKYQLKGKPYTASDDAVCTRVNLYNGWVTSVPEQARTVDGSLNYATPNLLDPETLGHVETISVTFHYAPGK